MNLRGMISNIPGLSQLQDFLKGLNFPASKQDVTNKARENGADDNVRSLLDRLPDRIFQSKDDVMNELSKMK